MHSWFNPWSLSVAFQVLMLVHFFRNRPEFYWFFVIVFFGPIGSLVYFIVEVLPGLRLKPPVIQRFERQRRRQWLERIVQDSPSQEAITELAQIHAAEGRHPEAIEWFSRAVERDPEDIEGRYGRGLAYLELQDFAKAAADLEQVVRHDPTYRLHSACLSLAEAYEALGDDEKARQSYEGVLARTPSSRAYFGYGRLLAEQGETAKARQMMDEILNKQAGLPRYLRRQERPWVRHAKAFLKTLD